MIPDTEVDWYDFGGGIVALDLEDKPAEKIMALCCARGGRYFYRVFNVEEGGSAPRTMDDIKAEYGPILEAYANEHKDEVKL